MYIMNILNGRRYFGEGEETNLTVCILFLCLFPQQQSLSFISLALPYIAGMHLYACRGAGCGMRKFLLEVLFCRCPRTKSCHLLSISCAPDILCTEHCLIQFTTPLEAGTICPHFADKEAEA